MHLSSCLCVCFMAEAHQAAGITVNVTGCAHGAHFCESTTNEHLINKYSTTKSSSLKVNAAIFMASSSFGSVETHKGRRAESRPPSFKLRKIWKLVQIIFTNEISNSRNIPCPLDSSPASDHEDVRWTKKKMTCHTKVSGERCSSWAFSLEIFISPTFTSAYLPHFGACVYVSATKIFSLLRSLVLVLWETIQSCWKADLEICLKGQVDLYGGFKCPTFGWNIIQMRQ